MRRSIRHRSLRLRTGALLFTALLAGGLVGITLVAAQTPAPPRSPTSQQAKPRHSTHSAAARPSPVATPAAAPQPVTPNWPINDQPAPATIAWDSSGLRIDAANSSLKQILGDISNCHRGQGGGLRVEMNECSANMVPASYATCSPSSCRGQAITFSWLEIRPRQHRFRSCSAHAIPAKRLPRRLLHPKARATTIRPPTAKWMTSSSPCRFPRPCGLALAPVARFARRSKSLKKCSANNSSNNSYSSSRRPTSHRTNRTPVHSV